MRIMMIMTSVLLFPQTDDLINAHYLLFNKALYMMDDGGDDEDHDDYD